MLKNIVLLYSYAFIYQVVHKIYLFKYFSYMGYSAVELSSASVCSTVVCLGLPIFLLPKDRGFMEISFTYFYLLLYAPVMITFMNHYSSISDLLIYQLHFLVGFILIFWLPKLFRFKILPLKPRGLSINSLLTLSVVVLVILMYNFRSSFKIVSFEDVYIHRAQVNINSGYVGYFLLWNTYLIAPLVLIHGLLRKNKKLIFYGIISVISIYGMTSSKISLFIPIGIIASYYIIKNSKSIFQSFAFGLSCLMVLMLGLVEKYFMISAVILMRTFGISGLLTYQYNEFFNLSPHTYLSHVNLVNLLTNAYPYNESLGFVVGSYFVEGSLNNANANFWATDGLAGFGMIGIIIISLIMGLFFSVLKSIERTDNKQVISLIIIPFCFIVLNVSFFTAILSGGFIMIVIYYILYEN